MITQFQSGCCGWETLPRMSTAWQSSVVLQLGPHQNCIHIQNIVSLCKAHPEIAAVFNNGNITVQKTRCTFSSMAIEQAHEQNNVAVKSDVSLSQILKALRHRMVAGPEMMTAEFEASIMHKRHCSTSKQRVPR